MPWEFSEHHVRPNVFTWSPRATQERGEVRQRRQQAQKAYVEGKAKIESGQLERAEELLTLSVACWPDNPRFTMALGECIAFHRQDPERGMPWFDQTIEAHDSPAHRASRARGLAALGRLEDAVADCESAVAGDPHNGVYLRARGMLRERLGEYFEAVVDYSKAIAPLREAGHPTFECLFNRGYCQKLLGNLKEAITDMEAAALLSPSCMDVKTCLGQMYLLQKRYRGALACFSTVALQQRNAASAASNLSLAQYMSVIAEEKPHAASGVGVGAAAVTAAAPGDGAMSRAGTVGRLPTSPSFRACRTGSSRISAATAAVAVGAGGGGVPSRMAGCTPGKVKVNLQEILDPDFAEDEGPLPTVEVEELMSDDDGSEEEEEESANGAESPAGKVGHRPVVGDGRSGGAVNSHPKAWLLQILGGSTSTAVTDLRQRQLLEQALHNVNAAIELYDAFEGLRGEASGGDGGWCGPAAGQDGVGPVAAAAAAPPKRKKLSKAGEGVAVSVGEAADIPEGLLLMLTNAVRVPGSAVVHDKEIEEGELIYNRGLIQLALGRLEEAEADLSTALQSNPHHAHYPYYNALVFAQKGEYAKAAAADRAALKLNPVYFPALYHLALVLHLQGFNAEAIQRLDTALLLQPRSGAVTEARGRVLQELDRHAEALPALRLALELLPADEAIPAGLRARLHYAIAQTAIATHQPGLMRDALRQARLHGQDPGSVYNLRGLLARRERKPSKALAYLSLALRHAPQEARYYFDRGECHASAADHASAVTDYSATAQLLPHASAHLLYVRGLSHAALAQSAKALSDLEAAAALAVAVSGSNGQLQPDERLREGSKLLGVTVTGASLSAGLWRALGEARLGAGRPAAAVEALARANAMLLQNPGLLHDLARATLASGDPGAAVSVFTTVLQLEPSNARAMFGRALAHRALRAYEAAAADFEAAKRMDLTNPALRVDYKACGDIDVLAI